MTSLVYSAYPQTDLTQLTEALNHQHITKPQLAKEFHFIEKGSRHYLQIPQLWRVLQAVFTGVDSPDNDKLIASIDGMEYLDGWSPVGAAYINAPDVVAIADVLSQVDFEAQLAEFNASLKHDDISEEELAAFAVEFHLKGCEEFDDSDTPERVAELSSWFERLRAFYRMAADEGCGVIMEFIEKK